MHNTKKGQGTIEYIVIIAVVIVLALAITIFLLYGLNSGSQIAQASLKASWLSKEVTIDDFVVDDEGTGRIVIVNNTSEQLIIKRIYVDDENVYEGEINIASFSKYTAGPFTGITPCDIGKKYKIKIVYEAASGLEKIVEGYVTVQCIATIISGDEEGLNFVQLTDANLELGETINVSAATGYFTLIDSNFINYQSLTYGNEGFGDSGGIDLNTTKNTGTNYIELDLQVE